MRVDLERGTFCGGVCEGVRVDLERGRHLVNQIYKVSSVFVLG